jgi:two-component system sensor histidine kinase KdpD
VSAVTLAAFLFSPVIGAHATALIFLLTVVVLGSTVGRGPTLVAATMSALLWDFFFLPPIYAFRITNFEDALLFGMYFAVALVMGQLTARIRAQAAAERQREGRTMALYLLTRELTAANNLEQMLQRAVNQTGQAFNAQVALLLPDSLAHGRLMPQAAGNFKLAHEEGEAANAAFDRAQPAGKFTSQLPGVEGLYLPLLTGGRVVGVIGLRFGQSLPPTIHQRNLLDAFAQQIAIAIERHRSQEVSERARVLAESDRLGQSLLNSMSHELRTPIAAIQNATSNLAELKEGSWSAPERAMIAEIQEATERLNRLTGNMLDITRLESGHVQPKLNECDVSDLVHLAVAETEKLLARHKVSVEISAGLPLVRMDFVLMHQAMTNLLSNAALHTPPGTEVRVSAVVAKADLVIEVADRGPGMPPASIARAFEKFYRGPSAGTGGTGLGLSLVKGFVEAQGGAVTAGNRPGGGAVFTIRLPLARTASTSLEPTV